MKFTLSPALEYCRADKSDKKAIKSFYRRHQYSAGFMGLDSTYLVKDGQEIIACVIYSYLQVENRQSFLHALVVDPVYRRRAIAGELLDYSRAFHPLTVCFAASELAPLYLSRNFIQASPERLTAPLAVRYQQYVKKKPALAIFIRDTPSPKPGQTSNK